MLLTSTSTYWLKLPRRTVRPSWVASQAAAKLGDSAFDERMVSPALLVALALVKATPGVRVR